MLWGAVRPEPMTLPEAPLRGVALALVVALLAPGAARAQQAITPPRGAEAARYEAAAARVGAETHARYLDAGKGAHNAPGLRLPDLRVNAAVWQTVAVVFALAAAITLWLRFGGTGALLRGQPRRERRPARAPEGWEMKAEEAVPADLLARLAAMADRRAALVLMLRHALLAAAGRAGVRLARADTEREAFARLPATLPGRAALSQLLREAELANYGGRPVTEAVFASCLDGARELIGGAVP